MLYGMGPQALAAELGLSVGEAQQLMVDFRRSHATLNNWMAVSGTTVRLGDTWQLCTLRHVHGLWAVDCCWGCGWLKPGARCTAIR